MKRLAVLAAFSLLQACHNGPVAATGKAPAPARTEAARAPAWPWPHRAGAQCPLRAAPPGSWLLDSPQAARQVLNADPEAWLGQAIAWADVQLLVHALPVQPNLGLRLELPGPAPEAGRASRPPVLRVRVLGPAPDAMLPTALGRPCLLVLVPRASAPGLRVQQEGSASGSFTPTLVH